MSTLISLRLSQLNQRKNRQLSTPLQLVSTPPTPSYLPFVWQPIGPPEILPAEIEQPVQEIGGGTFGKVLRGQCRGKQVAIKVLHKPVTDERSLAAFRAEVQIMSQIFHPNICLFMGACTQPGNFFIVSEYLPGGDVEKLLHSQKEVSLYRRMKMAKDAALGMNWLHCSNPVICHRDLKSSNLLIDETGTVKVCDFGLSQMKPLGAFLRDDRSAKGTPLWMAPEVMMFKEFNEKCDVYSFGIVLWELLTRQEPFAHHNDYAKFRKAVCELGERPPIPPDTEPFLAELIQRCWAADPTTRPSMKEVLERLEVVLVNVAVSDLLGRNFWLSAFYKNSEKFEEIAWNRFSTELLKFLRLPNVDPNQARNQYNVNLRCLKMLLVDKKQEKQVVLLEEFGRLLKWFGPITPPESTPSNQTFLDYVRILCSKAWFHGKTDKEEAEARLSGKSTGTFLIRFSSIDGFFTVSVLLPNRRIAHHRVEHFPGGGFVINTNQYTDLEKLVLGESAWLQFACSGSMYQSIFSDTQGGYVFGGK